MTRLYIIEGLPCSGKSSTAPRRWLHSTAWPISRRMTTWRISPPGAQQQFAAHFRLDG